MPSQCVLVGVTVTPTNGHEIRLQRANGEQFSVITNLNGHSQVKLVADQVPVSEPMYGWFSWEKEENDEPE